MRPRGCRGQHTTEFTLLIGIAATVAVGMQHFVHKAIELGVAHTTNVVLEAPGCLDTDDDGKCDCPDLDRDDACDDETLKELEVNARRAADETGDAAFGRTTTTADGVVGHSVNEDIRLHFFGPD